LHQVLKVCLTDTPLKPHSQGKAKIPNSLLATEHHDASERKKQHRL
jgi:hypothetical protein